MMMRDDPSLSTSPARRWCDLNRGERRGMTAEEAWAEMSRITDLIGLKACLKEWNRQRGMSARDFEEWWGSRRESVMRRLGR